MLEQLVGRLRDRQAELALQSMQAPAADHAAYRQMVGHWQGLGEALQFIEELLNDADERDRSL